MKAFRNGRQANILLFNAPTFAEAKRIRRTLLERRLIKGGFILPVDSGYIDDSGKIREDHDYFVVFAHTDDALTDRALETIEEISDAFGLTWKLKAGTDNYADWVFSLN